MTTALHSQSPSLRNVESWFAIGTGALLLVGGVSRRSVPGMMVAASSAPLLYRAATGRWPIMADGHKTAALAADRGVHVRESIRLEMPVSDVFRFWRRLEDLPKFMSHLE